MKDSHPGDIRTEIFAYEQDLKDSWPVSPRIPSFTITSTKQETNPHNFTEDMTIISNKVKSGRIIKPKNW